jgi:hypothetical protein
MDTYTHLALDWLATQPAWAGITDDPQTWAHEMGERIFQRTRELTDQLAPPVPDESFENRIQRLNAAWRTAEELAIDEHLPSATDGAPPTGWTPLMPDLSDLL